MKCLSSAFIITCIYIAFAVGFVPPQQKRLCLLQVQAQSSYGTVGATDNQFASTVEGFSKTIHEFLDCNERNEIVHKQWWQKVKTSVVALAMIPLMLGVGSVNVRADDELAKFAAEGHKVGVDGQCFIKKCPFETSKCANDRTCLKGLSCLARCKGGSMCSTGCFAKFGSSQLDGLLQCSVEKNDCVQVPGKENVGWKPDKLSDLPTKPLTTFKPISLQGTWYKNMGLDSRYDCFDCQRNRFNLIDKDTIGMEALFRIPRPNYPGYLQNKIEEELHVSDPRGSNPLATLQSEGQMFGLTFWENWYVLGDTQNLKMTPQLGIVSSAFASTGESKPDMKLVFYTGHTLQGSYKGAFLYSRMPSLSPAGIETGKILIKQAGLDPMKFCKISNQCFIDQDPKSPEGRKKAQLQAQKDPKDQNTPFWYLGQNFFRATESIAGELADWFDDPAILSEWLVSQQVKMIQEQPFAVSPFAGTMTE